MKAVAGLNLTHAVALLGLLALPAAGADSDDPETVSMIVQAADFDTANEAVKKVGGTITHELKIIKAVVCDLTQEQREALEEMDGVRLHENRGVQLDQPNEDNEDQSPSGSR